MPTLTRLILAFACLLVAPLVVMADELPKDTNKIKSLTVEQARRLVADFRGSTVAFMVGKEARAVSHGGLPLHGLTSLDEQTAEALSHYRGEHLVLGLTTLDAATAKALAGFKGEVLVLNGLTTLDAETANGLAEFNGKELVLCGLKSLDADTAKAIAAFKGQLLHLAGLTTLDADTAKALAANENWKGRLPALTAFESPDSVAIAKALATRKGPLSLPNLKKISPKTLSALIEKEDINIPLIETLELIPEPDGSPTEDFVIPEAFQKK